jgi:signal transduction histidine kinase
VATLSLPQTRFTGKLRWNHLSPACRVVLSVMLFAGLSVFAVWCIAMREIASERKRVIAEAAQQAGHLASAHEEHTLRTILAVDQSVLFLKHQYELRHGIFQLSHYVDSAVLAKEVLNLYAVVDTSGFVTDSTQPFPRINLSEREHIRVHATSPNSGLFISKPVPGLVSNKWSMQITRRLNNPSGGFDGVIVASMDAFYFTRVYQASTAGRNSLVSLVGSDGIVRAQQLGDVSSVGQDLSKSRAFQTMLGAGAQTIGTTTELDGSERVVAYRKLANLPLYLVVGLSLQEVTATMEDYQRTVHTMAGLTSVLIVLFCGMLLGTIARIEESRQAALQANEAKSQYLANMSHELRTPLSGILGYAELLKTDLNDPEQRKFAMAIYKSGAHLLELVNTVLDLEKVSSGMMETHIERENLADLISEVVNGHRASIRTKGLELRFELREDLPVYVSCDRLKLTQVLNNLLHNAIKFTDTGFIAVRAGLRDAPAGQELFIEVADSGIGIPKALQTRVFEKFVQINGADGRAQQGSGLGLALVKELTALMGGNITLDCTSSKGSIFTVSLPLEPLHSS